MASIHGAKKIVEKNGILNLHYVASLQSRHFLTKTWRYIDRGWKQLFMDPASKYACFAGY